MTDEPSIEAWDCPGMHTAELPGRGIAIEASQLTNSVWALCVIERRWWEFWQPKERERWVNVVLPSPNIEG